MYASICEFYVYVAVDLDEMRSASSDGLIAIDRTVVNSDVSGCQH
jgi:hypothetical protein